MNENLIYHRYSNNYNEEDIFKILYNDPVYDTLKHIHLKSKFRRILIKLLLYFYDKHFSLFLIEFLIGAIFLILPIILNKITNLNIPFLYLISILIFFIFYFVKNIYKCFDDRKNKYNFYFYWERSNLLTNLNIILNLILILFLIYFIRTIFDYINHNKIENEINVDLINKILILLLNNNNDDYYFENKKEKNFNINEYYLKTKNFFIVLSIFLSFLFLKSFLLKVKYQTEKFVFYFNLLIMTLIYLFFFNKIKNENNKIFSIIQFILLSLSLFFYIIWIFRNMYKRIKKKREKYFCIKKLSISFILFATLNDILLFFATILFFIYSLLILLKKNEEIHIKIFNIKNIVFIILVGNCFYFGRNVLEEIYKPLCIQYIPARLKNKFYIKVKRTMKKKINK